MIETDKKINVINENHIFEKMGLTDIDQNDLLQYLTPEQNKFLKTQKSVEAGNSFQVKPKVHKAL